MNEFLDMWQDYDAVLSDLYAAGKLPEEDDDQD